MSLDAVYSILTVPDIPTPRSRPGDWPRVAPCPLTALCNLRGRAAARDRGPRTRGLANINIIIRNVFASYADQQRFSWFQIPGLLNTCLRRLWRTQNAIISSHLTPTLTMQIHARQI